MVSAGLPFARTCVGRPANPADPLTIHYCRRLRGAGLALADGLTGDLNMYGLADKDAAAL